MARHAVCRTPAPQGGKVGPGQAGKRLGQGPGETGWDWGQPLDSEEYERRKS